MICKEFENLKFVITNKSTGKTQELNYKDLLNNFCVTKYWKQFLKDGDFEKHLKAYLDDEYGLNVTYNEDVFIEFRNHMCCFAKEQGFIQ